MVVMATPAQRPWQRRQRKRSVPCPAVPNSEAASSEPTPAIAGTSKKSPPIYPVNIPHGGKDKAEPKRYKECGRTSPTRRKWGVVPPRIKSQRTLSNSRGCRCWTFKMLEIEGADRDRREGNEKLKGHRIGIGRETRRENKTTKTNSYHSI